MAETKAELLAKELTMEPKNALLKADDDTLSKALDFAEGYKAFLDNAKTEREAVKETIKAAEDKGFKEFEYGKVYNAGDKVYINNRGKSIALCVMGKEAVEKGVNISAAHIDSPRLDLKPNPLYDEIEFALFKTHYYG